MEIVGTSVQPSSNTPVGRALRPVTDANGQLQDRVARIPARDVPATVEDLRPPVTAGHSYPRIGTHPSQHAIHAYTALERSEEQEYMSTVLGIDEYA